MASAGARRDRRGALHAAIGLAVTLFVPAAHAQSAADLAARLAIDGRTSDWAAVEAVFRNADICSTLALSCGPDEERRGDSVGSQIQDLVQIRVTWDAVNLYVAVDGALGGQALFLGLDTGPGGLDRTSALDGWRRAIRFGGEVRPDAFLVASDTQARPELWLATGLETAIRVHPDTYAAVASFEGEAAGRALEAAIPWTVLFPGQPLAVNPEPGAPPQPMVTLPVSASERGLRLVAAVISATEGLGALDAAPDGTEPLSLDTRRPSVLDKGAFVDWDATRASAEPRFVDFGAAVQTQAAARFVPAAPAPPVGARLLNLRTFTNGAPSRLLLAGAGLDLTFAFDVEPMNAATLFVSASVYSLRGDRVRVLYRDVPRQPVTAPAPFGAFGDPALDRWDGRDAEGRSAPGGLYVLRLGGGPAPGVETSAEERAITVVR